MAHAARHYGRGHADGRLMTCQLLRSELLGWAKLNRGLVSARRSRPFSRIAGTPMSLRPTYADRTGTRPFAGMSAGSTEADAGFGSAGIVAA